MWAWKEMGAPLAFQNRRKGKWALRATRLKGQPFSYDILNEIFHQGKSLPLACGRVIVAKAQAVTQPQEPVRRPEVRSHFGLESDEGWAGAGIELPLVEKLSDDVIVSLARPSSLVYVGKATANLPQDVIDAFKSHDLLV